MYANQANINKMKKLDKNLNNRQVILVCSNDKCKKEHRIEKSMTIYALRCSSCGHMLIPK